MTRIAILLVAVFMFGCDKPTPEDCEKALRHMKHLLGTENLNETGLQGEVRRCRGGSSKEAVACAIKAQTLAELKACDFEKAPSGAGSAK